MIKKPSDHLNRLSASVSSTISKFKMITGGESVCVALSGGPDSTALLAILLELKSALGITVNACHFDHALRESSVNDLKFAVKTAEMMNVEIKTERNEKGRPETSIQNAARDMRYRFFQKALDTGYADIVATGHTMDDSVETSIMWMLRGAGPSAFGGISPVRGKFIRPLIETRKSALLSWLEAKGIDYIKDPTNDTNDYLRNRIRRSIIPALEIEAPKVVEAVARLARLTKGQSQLIDALAKEKIEKLVTGESDGYIALEKELVAKEPEAFRFSIYRAALKKAGLAPQKLSLGHIDSIDYLVCAAGLGKSVDLPGDFTARVDHGGLIFAKKKERRPIVETLFECPLEIRWGGGELTVSPAGQTDNGDIIDLDKIPSKIVFRARKPGDFLKLKNMKGRKPLKKFLIDRKTPSGLRDSIPLLAAGSEVLWAPGLFLAQSIAADESTKGGAVLRWG